MLLDIHYSRDSAWKQKLCVRVDGLRICVLEEDIARCREATYDVAPAGDSDESIGNNTDHLRPQRPQMRPFHSGGGSGTSQRCQVSDYLSRRATHFIENPIIPTPPS